MKPKVCLRVVALMALVVAAATGAGASGAEGETSCPIVASTDFAIYGQVSEGGVAASSRRWMAHFFDWWQAQDPAVGYVFLSAAEAQACTNLKSTYPDLRMWVQPGGNAYDQQSALGATGKANINGFIDRGGAYLGVCAGAYYAAPDYWWEGEHYAHPHLLGAYPRTMEGAISRIAPWPGYAVTALGNGRNAIYYGGPTIGLQHTDLANLAGEKVASFSGIDGHLPAIIIYRNLLLTSVHLEAFEDDESSGLSAADRIENYRYLATLINRVARTNFAVPGATL
jgi:Biotin-protein ligase, N terminal